MQEWLLSLLRCPVTRSPLQLTTIAKSIKSYDTGDEEVIAEGILFAAEDWFYPVIDGIPRLNVESFIEFSDFLAAHLPDYAQRRAVLEQKFPAFIHHVLRKNRKTRESFAFEWSLYDYDRDRTWEAGKDELLERFLLETGETGGSIDGKLIFDAGCGNGLLDSYIAAAGATVIGMDFSNSIVKAYNRNRQKQAIFIIGDVQFPPLDFRRFDIVHCSGVLIHTNNTELSFSCIESCVKPGGKLSTWLYHPRKDRIHNLFNRIRRLMVPLPLRIKYYILASLFLPPSYLIKKLKGNSQTKREMMIALLDGFTPQFRWEHEPDEAAGWFSKRGYVSVGTTTTNTFGYNIIGVKAPVSTPG